MKFKQEDFKKMRYNPKEVPKGSSIISHFPTLGMFKELQTKIPGFDHDKILGYVIYLIDENSPVYKVDNFEQRHALAAQEAGIKESDIGKLDLKSNSALNTLFTGYLKAVNNDEFALWFSIKQNYYNNLHEIRDVTTKGKDPVMEMKRKQEIAQAMQEDLKSIRELEIRLFKDERIKERISEEAMSKMVNWSEMLADDAGTVT